MANDRLDLAFNDNVEGIRHLKNQMYVISAAVYAGLWTLLWSNQLIYANGRIVSEKLALFTILSEGLLILHALALRSMATGIVKFRVRLAWLYRYFDINKCIPNNYWRGIDMLRQTDRHWNNQRTTSLTSQEISSLVKKGDSLMFPRVFYTSSLIIFISFFLYLYLSTQSIDFTDIKNSIQDDTTGWLYRFVILLLWYSLMMLTVALISISAECVYSCIIFQEFGLKHHLIETAREEARSIGLCS